MMKRLFWREAPPDRKEEGEYSNRRLVGGISVRINLLKYKTIFYNVFVATH
ncbi:hypothetical protein [Salmonella enterica]|uniref:hypothetical protein n=1 Tax=Salmonella enterica TaxID=28901 RepID=UPI00237FFF42|nr:hypothetical protein [Salmonella enterica]WDY19855.1 hypothetical protein PQQ01_00035 [Salmonella enterica subsp. enterica serovar Derby]